MRAGSPVTLPAQRMRLSNGPHVNGGLMKIQSVPKQSRKAIGIKGRWEIVGLIPKLQLMAVQVWDYYKIKRRILPLRIRGRGHMPIRVQRLMLITRWRFGVPVLKGMRPGCVTSILPMQPETFG